VSHRLDGRLRVLGLRVRHDRDGRLVLDDRHAGMTVSLKRQTQMDRVIRRPCRLVVFGLIESEIFCWFVLEQFKYRRGNSV
jgi:hypothetical protein